MNRHQVLDGGAASVIGASSRLGQRAAVTLTAQGWHVVLAARRVERLHETA